MAFRTIKNRITFITVTFTLIMAILVMTFSFSTFRSFAVKSMIQSTEFNLQFIGARARENMVAIDSLVRWCTTNSLIPTYLEESGNTVALATYDRVKEEVMNNHAQAYIDRLIITDVDHTKLLHTGLAISGSRPVKKEELDAVLPASFKRNTGWNTIGNDPYMLDRTRQSLPIKRIITETSSTKVIGQLYLAISTDLLLDLVADYRMDRESALYLSLGEDLYRIDGKRFVPVADATFSPTSYGTTGTGTTVQRVRFAGGDHRLFVTCPTGFQDIAISQSLPLGNVVFARSIYFLTLAIITIAVIGFGIAMALLLNRLINRPVSMIQRKVRAIAKSDFSADPAIEWDNEFGDIGKGMNRMSQRISALLDSRIADEKRKQELEYRMLQSQINPHFLYNTLNSIKWMATIQNATGIAEMTTALSRLMKNISKANGMVIALSEELALLDDYFTIQKYRYGGTLVLDMGIPKSLYGIGIPRFTLQPLVENAIFHGIEPKGGIGTVTISARTVDEGDVLLSVADDGIGMTEAQISSVFASESPSANGMFKEIGIGNVDSRIRYVFGSGYGLSITSKPGERTTVTVRIPNRIKEQSDHDEADIGG